ncbi:MAG: hypothetical protein CM1200mP10_11310 [Candidatus Neomarinimicrobiota bacterium]|nr:MAG: hypothetical protein CM1200mP10_11310 [Candidatus Neomarinimicrobiota bacterium]
MYLKVKFTTTGTPTDGDQIHVTIATDPDFLTNLNVYTVVSSPIGIIGDFYFQTNVSAGTTHPAVAYDSWFWEKIVVNGDTYPSMRLQMGKPQQIRQPGLIQQIMLL